MSQRRTFWTRDDHMSIGCTAIQGAAYVSGQSLDVGRDCNKGWKTAFCDKEGRPITALLMIVSHFPIGNLIGYARATLVKVRISKPEMKVFSEFRLLIFHWFL